MLRPLALAFLLAAAGCQAGATEIDSSESAFVEPDPVMAYEQRVVRELTATPRSTPEQRKAAGEYIKARFTEIGLTPQDHAYGTGTNVFAILPSTNGSLEHLVYGAHFDTVRNSPGANDNATGVSMVLSVASELSKLTTRTANVIFVGFDQEEIGLVGSKAFAKKLDRERVNVRAVHTVDQMGWDRNGDRLVELERPDDGLAELYRAAAVDLGVSIPMVETSTGSTNHTSFRPLFPAIGLTEGYRTGDTTPDYHRASDTYDKVNFPYLLSSTRLTVKVFENQLR